MTKKLMEVDIHKFIKKVNESEQKYNDLDSKHKALLKKIERLDYHRIRNVECFIDENSRDEQPSRVAELRAFVSDVRELK